MKCPANSSRVRAARSRPAPRNSMRSSGAGTATSRRPSSRSTRRNSPEFMRAVIESTIENDRSAYGTARSALATTHSHSGYRRAAASTAGMEISTPWASHRLRAGARRDKNHRRNRHRERRRWQLRSPSPRLLDTTAGSLRDRANAAAPQRLPHIPGMFCPPFLRLKQIDISAACDVERMSARANHSPLYRAPG